MDDIVYLAMEELKEKYVPHTIILYGSHARNEATETSDIDIACFCDRVDKQKDARIFNGVYLDAWIYPTDFLKSVPEEAFRFGDGVVLYDTQGFGSDYLTKVKQKLQDGKPVMSDMDREHLEKWVMKMLERAHDKNLDGNYRRTWLQHELLEIYFEIRGLWYLGSKKSFNYLQHHDKAVFNLFESMYKEPLNLELLVVLAKKIIRI